jgi:hypothetical protein
MDLREGDLAEFCYVAAPAASQIKHKEILIEVVLDLRSSSG